MGQTIASSRPARSFPQLWKVIRWGGLSVLVLLLAAYFGIGAAAASQLTLPKRIFDPAVNPGVYNLAYENFKFPARNDGVQIAAWYIPSEENERAVILVHGRDNSRSNGYGNEFVTFANTLH